MFPIEQLEVSAMEFGLDSEEMCEALEWAFCCAVESDATLLKEIEGSKIEGDPDGIEGRIWVPDRKDLRQRVLELYHDTPIMGHLGISGTTELVTRGGYYWENMHEYIKQYVNNCTTCIRRRGTIGCMVYYDPYQYWRDLGNGRNRTT